MQLYHGTYLESKNGNYSISIPEHILTTSEFKKYSKINVYLFALKKKENEIHYTDEIQVCITPLSFEEIENLYYFELSMNNVPGAFSSFLELFREKGINILECRAIDSVEDMQGKVVLIATINNEFLTTKNKQNTSSIQQILNYEYKTKNPEFKRKKNPIIVRKPIDNHFTKQYSANSNLKGSSSTTFENNLSGTEYKIPLPDEVLKQTIKENKVFLGITYVSEGNYILVKFKSINEIIVPIKIEFSSNKPGALAKVINPLGDIGVNLRLILPYDLSDKPIYLIYFNIENTKLKLFDKDTIEKILQAHIKKGNTIEKIELNKTFFTTNSKLTINRDYIKESDDLFNKHIFNHINDNWINKLAKCNGKECNPKTCKLSLSWNKSKSDISDLIEQISNSNLSITIPDKIIKIKSDKKSKYCNLQSDFQILYQNFHAFINPSSDSTRKTEENNLSIHKAETTKKETLSTEKRKKTI